jgi:hypothetical protein
VQSTYFCFPQYANKSGELLMTLKWIQFLYNLGEFAMQGSIWRQILHGQASSYNSCLFHVIPDICMTTLVVMPFDLLKETICAFVLDSHKKMWLSAQTLPQTECCSTHLVMIYGCIGSSKQSLEYIGKLW